MKITNTALKHSTTVFVLITIIILLGGYSYITLPREAAPDITIPYIIVSTIYVGVSPQDMENLVTRPIEMELRGLENVKEITSTSGEGYSSIFIEFESGTDIDFALQRVKDRVDFAKSDLPTDAEDPVVQEINLSNIPIIVVNIAGDYGLVLLKEIAEDFEDLFETIPGVLDARVVGGLEREVQVRAKAS